MSTDDKTVFVNFFPSDWISGVVELSAEARGVYIQILALYWAKEGRVRDDDQWLARQCNLSTRRYRTIKNDLIACGKLVIKNGFIVNIRAETSLKNAKKQQEKASKKAQKAAEKRWENYTETAESSHSIDATSNAPSNANQTQTNSIRDNNLDIGSNISAGDFTEFCKELTALGGIRSNRLSFVEPKQWIEAGIPLETIKATVRQVGATAKASAKTISSFKYFDRAVTEAHQQKLKDQPSSGDGTEHRFVAEFSDVSDKAWAAKVASWNNGHGGWHPSWGPEPFADGCNVPPHVLDRWAAMYGRGKAA